MPGEKAGHRIGNRLAGQGIRNLSAKESEELLRSPHGESFDGVGEDVGALAAGQLELHGHGPHAREAVVYVRIAVRIGEPDDGGDRRALEVGRLAHAAGIRCGAKRAGADDALGVGGTNARVRPGEGAHGIDELNVERGGGIGHRDPPSVREFGILGSAVNADEDQADASLSHSWGRPIPDPSQRRLAREEYRLNRGSSPRPSPRS
jgi:hypothetical protein